MKVMHVCETVLGGIGTHLNEVLPSQKASLGKDNVRLIGPYEHLIQVPDITTDILLTYRRVSRIWGIGVLFIIYLYQLFRFRPDIVHAHSTFAGAIVRVLAPLTRAKIVYCPHCWATDRDQTRIISQIIGWLEYTMSLVTDKIVAVSEDERRKGIALGINPSKITTVHNGLKKDFVPVDPAEWKDDRLKVLYVGRLDRQKGIDTLLEAIKGLEDEVVVRIIGSNVIGYEKVCFNGFTNVEPLGWLDMKSVYSHMAACDIVVMPSRWEGLPIVAIEAMRTRRPIIASTVGGIPELIRHEETGLLIPPSDPVSLRNAFRKITTMDMAAMGDNAYRLFVEAFTSEKMCGAILSVYKEILPPTA
ncbi:MAG: glycosyltransferase family 1 protein [Proteobacteria bacterium]|nr:glycosyltransferase family 1 protein [Pseudomonadota bacterium]